MKPSSPHPAEHRISEDVYLETKQAYEEQQNVLYIQHQKLLHKLDEYHRLDTILDKLSAEALDIVDRYYRKHETWKCIEIEKKDIASSVDDH